MIIYENAGAISFPLGGIGAGSVGLAGDGRLIDFEWFHRPNRCSINPFSHFAIKAEAEGALRDCRVLQGDLQSGYMGNPGTGRELWVYGNGADRGTMAGLVHFSNTVFQGPFPIAQIKYQDPAFPGCIQLQAMNPLIPMNDRIPACRRLFSNLHWKILQKKAWSIRWPFPAIICLGLEQEIHIMPKTVSAESV